MAPHKSDTQPEGLAGPPAVGDPLAEDCRDRRARGHVGRIFSGFWPSVSGPVYLTRIPTSFYIVTLVFVAYVIVRAAPLVRPWLLRLVRRPAPVPASEGRTRAPATALSETVTESKST
jgi:hypothetical protein